MASIGLLKTKEVTFVQIFLSTTGCFCSWNCFGSLTVHLNKIIVELRVFVEIPIEPDQQLNYTTPYSLTLISLAISINSAYFTIDTYFYFHDIPTTSTYYMRKQQRHWLTIDSVYAHTNTFISTYTNTHTLYSYI